MPTVDYDKGGIIMYDEQNNKKSDDCKCKKRCVPQETQIENVELARAYVPFQKICSVYTGEEGLIKGTIFPELYQPYVKTNKKCNPCMK